MKVYICISFNGNKFSRLQSEVNRKRFVFWVVKCALRARVHSHMLKFTDWIAERHYPIFICASENFRLIEMCFKHAELWNVRDTCRFVPVFKWSFTEKFTALLNVREDVSNHSTRISSQFVCIFDVIDVISGNAEFPIYGWKVLKFDA